MITFEYRFDVVPGKQKEYDRYLAGAGKDIWIKFPGVKAVRTYKSIFGGSSPQRVVQVDLESLAALEKILANASFQKAKSIFHGLAKNVSDSLLIKVSEKKK